MRYLEKLLEAGFRHLDAVSFVLPEHVQQTADGERVMERLQDALRAQTNGAPLEIIGIIVGDQGLERALRTPGVTTLGYPYLISANFRRRNANLPLVQDALEWLNRIGVKTVTLADTVGASTAQEVGELFKSLAGFARTWNWKLICTRAGKTQRKKCLLPMRADAAASTAP